jgi:negative regulator of flagellin synthesis FlgM
MPIDINNSNLGSATAADQRQIERPDVADAHRKAEQEAAAKARTDSVELSREAHSLKQLQERLERQESFDQERVDAIKSAIQEGRYPIDTERLARNFYDLESKLNQ